MCTQVFLNIGMLYISVAIITKVRSRQYILYLEKTQPQVIRGEYVEITLSFMLPSYFSGVPCADNEYLEICDGYNQSANLLGVFCGRYIKSIQRTLHVVKIFTIGQILVILP